MKFRMVDRILGWEPFRSIRGIKTVSFEEYQLKARFGDPAHLPESLLLESLFQLASWLIVLSSDYTEIGLVARTAEARFLGMLRPGQRLLMEVAVRRCRSGGVVFDGRGSVGPEVIVQAQRCFARPVPLGDYCDPEDMRVLYSEISARSPDRSREPQP